MTDIYDQATAREEQERDQATAREEQERDQATAREEQERELAIAAARRSAPVLPYIGVCHNCEAPTAPSVRFCDAECVADFEKRKRAEAFK